MYWSTHAMTQGLTSKYNENTHKDCVCVCEHLCAFVLAGGGMGISVSYPVSLPLGVRVARVSERESKAECSAQIPLIVACQSVGHLAHQGNVVRGRWLFVRLSFSAVRGHGCFCYRALLMPFLLWYVNHMASRYWQASCSLKHIQSDSYSP